MSSELSLEPISRLSWRGIHWSFHSWHQDISAAQKKKADAQLLRSIHLEIQMKAMSIDPFFSSAGNKNSLAFSVPISCPLKWSLFIEADSLIVASDTSRVIFIPQWNKRNGNVRDYISIDFALFYWTRDSLFHVFTVAASLLYFGETTTTTLAMIVIMRWRDEKWMKCL